MKVKDILNLCHEWMACYTETETFDAEDPEFRYHELNLVAYFDGERDNSKYLEWDVTEIRCIDDEVALLITEPEDVY